MGILENAERICYNAYRQKNEVVIRAIQSENPEVASSGFSLGLVVVAISIKPFADIVATYTSSDGN
jgi:hypothetical protein